MLKTNKHRLARYICQSKGIVEFFFILFFWIGFTSLLSGQFNDEPYTSTIKQTKPDDNRFLTVEIILDIPEDIHVYASESNFFKISDIKSIGLGKIEIILPKLKNHKDFDGSEVKAFTGKSIITIRRQYIGTPDSPWLFKGSFQSQGCDNKTCFMTIVKDFSFKGTIPERKNKNGSPIVTTAEKKKPQTVSSIAEDARIQDSINNELNSLLNAFTIVNSANGYMNADEFINFMNRNESPATENVLHDKSVWWIILFVLLGGLALNLTPCVLPMIPINLAIIGAGANSGKMSGFIRGGAYGAGIALAYGALGAFAVLTGSKFGTLNATSWFNFGIAAIFIILGLAMFDVLLIDFSKYSARFGPGENKKGKLIPAFIMGIVAALLAGACVAPVVIAVLLQSTTMYTEGNYIGLLLPFLLGIGMALPWPFAGSGLSVMPKPGKWMNWVKKGFGVLIFCFAIYYMIIGFNLLKTLPASEENPVTVLTNGLIRAKKLKKPILIDFWATWCKNCTTMDSTTFKNTQVKEKLNDFVFIKFQAEKPNSEKIKPILDKFNVIGLPTYVILEGKNGR